MGRPSSDSRACANARSYGQTELVGKLVNRSNKIFGRKVQVRVGTDEWTLNVPDKTPVMEGRRQVSIHDVNLGTYVRAIGERIGPTRLRCTHVYVIGDRLALVKAGYGRHAMNGYVAAYAGYRSRYR